MGEAAESEVEDEVDALVLEVAGVDVARVLLVAALEVEVAAAVTEVEILDGLG